MKHFLLLIISTVLCINTGISQQKVSLDLQAQSATVLLQEIGRQSGLTLYFLPGQTDTVQVTVICKDADPIVVLKKALRESQLTVSVFQNELYILANRNIVTELPALVASLNNEDEQIESQSNSSQSSGKAQVANSEYKLYEIGRPTTETTATLTGKVVHFKTGETVAGASITIENGATGTITDKDGNYRLTVEPGFHELTIASLGIKDTKRKIRIYSDGQLIIETEEEIFLMDELTILSSRLNKVKETSMGVERFKMNEIKNIPTAFGEVDVLKAVLALPGVKSTGEVASGYNVRGSASDQNLILLNHSTIFNPTHLFGMLSVFNPDLVDDMELYMSNIPAKYGGRIASVLDVSSRSGNEKEFSGSASLGLLSSRIAIEGPIGSEKTTFTLGARTSNSDWLLDLIPEGSGYNNGSAGFFDVNAGVRHQLNALNTLSVHGYFSRDRFSFEVNEQFSYQNLNISTEWRQIISPELFVKYIAGYDSYSNRIANTINSYNAYELSTGIRQVHARADFDWYPVHDHSVNFGLSVNGISLKPGTMNPGDPVSLVLPSQLQTETAIETALYISDEWIITPKLAVNAGLRYSFYQLLGPRTYYNYNEDFLPSLGSLTDTVDFRGLFLKNYHGPEVRLSARYSISDDLSVKAGFNTMRQNIHKISNSTVMSPTDTWKLSDMHVAPQTGIQLAGGIYKNISGNALSASAELYYKTTGNYLDYRSGAQLIMNNHLETEVVSTQGRAYGVELSLKKPVGKLNGWISYTYARTLLRQSDPAITNPVNKGNWYPADFDKPHDFKVVGNFKFTHRYSVSANVYYSTGRPVTLPVAKYKFAGGEYIYYSDRNSHRIPDYFRMDASFNIEPSHNLTLLTHSTISIGVYNITGRDNVYSVYYKLNQGRLKGYQLSIFAVAIPYISYNIKF